jgi:hypothetical protein
MTDPKPKPLTINYTEPPLATPAAVVTPLLSDPQHNWWDTYNAALSGMYQNPFYVQSGPAYIHIQASAAADAAHGTYPPDEAPLP